MPYLRPMNLALDFGNTRIKAGFFEGSRLVERRVFANDQELIQAIATFQDPERCIIGSVTGDHNEVLQALGRRYGVMVFAADTPVPLNNKYTSAMTLGSDRMAGAVGAWSFFPGRPVLTIDAGTCIKYNFVTAGNDYLGGAISPGIPMRLNAMHQFTHALPQVAMDTTYERLVGQNTKESLLSGALLGSVAEVDGMIDRYRDLYPDLQVVMTGGDAAYLCRQMKNRFFADPDLLLHGLNAILNFNSER